MLPTRVSSSAPYRPAAHLGGLSAATAAIVDLMDAAGLDAVVVETVGAGQSEVEVAEIADCSVVVMAPGLGDDVQAIKSGILEIANVLVVNKTDLPGAQKLRNEFRAMLALRSRGRTEVALLETVASCGTGITALVDAIESRWKAPARARSGVGLERMRRLLAAAAAEIVRNHVLDAEGPHIERLAHDVRSGTVSLDEAALLVVEALVANGENDVRARSHD